MRSACNIFGVTDYLPSRWLKDHLASKYEINCRSVSQVFKDVWVDGEFAGGNKNRSLVLKD